MPNFTNTTQQTRFLRMLDRNAKLFTFQTFPDSETLKKKAGLTHVLHCGADDPRLQQLSAAGAGIYVTINETALEGRRTANKIRRVRTVFQEDDRSHSGPFPIEPTIVVETSPGRFHRYWLIAGEWPADEAGRRDFRGVIERMIADYGSDPGAKDISRVLRVPGFFNHKRGELFQVRITRVHPQLRRYGRDEILQAFPPRQTPVRQPCRFQGLIRLRHSKIDALIGTLLRATQGERNRLAFWVGCRLAELVGDGGLGRNDVVTLVAQAGSRVGLSYQEAERTAHSALREVLG